LLQCLDTLLDVGSAYIKSVPTFVQEVQKGVVDDEKDIQILAYQILHKTATMLPLQMLEVLDSLPTLFMKGLVDMLKHAKGMESNSPTVFFFFWVGMGVRNAQCGNVRTTNAALFFSVLFLCFV
jgi:hypothetical protein